MRFPAHWYHKSCSSTAKFSGAVRTTGNEFGSRGRSLGIGVVLNHGNGVVVVVVAAVVFVFVAVVVSQLCSLLPMVLVVVRTQG